VKKVTSLRGHETDGDLPDVGTIVRLTSYVPRLAVVVPFQWGPEHNWELTDLAFTRLLEGGYDNYLGAKPEYNGGWYVGKVAVGSYEIVPDDQVPDEILALAMRCLLDPTFIPEISD
jgi:hypothetical protein